LKGVEKMRITQEVDYALRVILYLYKHNPGSRVEAKVISDSENVPPRFLLKLLRKLASAGILKSYRGTGGGYAVEKSPEEISLLEVVEAIDGPVYINKCLYDANLCNLRRADVCEVHRELGKFQSAVVAEMKALTFREILAENGGNKTAV
jgi:Rrf2 family transcriptional regulator, iron-sulfur cluster assembly transcription factor